MPTLRQFQIDAFTRLPFHGNPAAVVPLEEWLPDETMQAIASENNLSETAFICPLNGSDSGGADFHLRWFTPAIEVDLCGHATVATAHALFSELGWDRDSVTFRSRSGPLRAARTGDGAIELDFPEMPLTTEGITEELKAAVADALGRAPTELYDSMDLICVFDNKRDVHELRPDFGKLAALDHVRAVGVTAPGAGHDFVARLFAPQSGVNEDPVTGSLYTMLAPYWANRLGKRELTAHQVSHRPGEVRCRLDDAAPGRVFIAGHAVTTIRSELLLPEPVHA
ncbi:MAG: PhzF family phenazine biosynthesis protein [Phycisphaerales bacterium JB040]